MAKKEIRTAPKNNLKENKPMPSLIPMDIILEVLEPAYREGLIKYWRESWRIGFATSVMYDGAVRHLSAYFHDKEDFDPDAEKLGIKKLHLGGALFSILCMCDTHLNHPELDDRDKDWGNDDAEDEKLLSSTVMRKAVVGNSVLVEYHCPHCQYINYHRQEMPEPVYCTRCGKKHITVEGENHV